MTRRERSVLRVIEGRPGPGRGVMTRLARGREELWLRRMARVRRVVVIGLVTTDTGRRQRRVIVVHVAIRANARRNHVGTGKGEGCVVVVERRIRPVRCVVA